MAKMRKYSPGDRVNDWTIIEYVSNRTKWKCQCVCGRVSLLKRESLCRGMSKGCWKCAGVKRRKGIERLIWNKILNGAKYRSIDVELSLDQITNLLAKQNYKCALTGLPIELPTYESQGRYSEYTASLDRINSDENYTIDNIQWVHKSVNRMKNNLSEEEFFKLCRLIVTMRDAKAEASTNLPAPRRPVARHLQYPSITVPAKLSHRRHMPPGVFTSTHA